MQAVTRAQRRPGTAARILLGFVSLLIEHALAQANGAFPDSGQILLPADRPDQIFVSTNFGMLRTDDSGVTWRWICEEAIGRTPRLFAIGPPPTNAIYTVPNGGLVTSTDAGGSWKHAKGELGLEKIQFGDAFADRSDGRRVLSIGAFAPGNNLMSTAALYESKDGGLTFGGPKYQAPDGSFLNGVEIANTDPKTVYLTQYEFQPGRRPFLLRSVDAGATFEVIDTNVVLSGRLMYILAIDPVDPRKVYFRVAGEARDAFAYTEDGGTTIKVTLELDTTMSAFVRRRDGRLLVGTKGASFQSLDGGKTFVPWATTLQFRGLGERDGVLYALGDNFVDGLAVGVSRDDGATWQKLLQFHEICGVVRSPEVEAICEPQPWSDLKLLFGIPLDACMPVQMEPPTGDTAILDDGCACDVGGEHRTKLGFIVVLGVPLALVLALRRRRSCSSR